MNIVAELFMLRHANRDRYAREKIVCFSEKLFMEEESGEAVGRVDQLHFDSLEANRFESPLIIGESHGKEIFQCHHNLLPLNPWNRTRIRTNARNSRDGEYSF